MLGQLIGCLWITLLAAFTHHHRHGEAEGEKVAKFSGGSVPGANLLTFLRILLQRKLDYESLPAR